MKIQIGEYEVYETGEIIGVLDQPIKFFIEDLIFEMLFKNDASNTNSRVEIDTIPPKTLRITYYNFNNASEMGNSNPAKIGQLKDKSLFLLYRITSSNNNAGKTYSYTLLTKQIKESGNG